MEQKSCKGCKYIEDETWSQCSTCANYAKWTPVSLTQKELEEKIAFKLDIERGINGTTAYDVVSKPKHYMLFDEMEVKERAFEGEGIEVRDVLRKLVEKIPPGDNMLVADYVQMMQYLMRFMEKNGVEDLKKARWYLDKMIEAY